MCAMRYYLVHCVNVRIFVEVIQCPAIKTLVLGMHDFSFTCIFTRTFTRLLEKSQMLILGLWVAGQDLNGFQTLLNEAM